MTAEQNAASFRREVFECSACEALGFGFRRPAPAAPFHKFPPTIGAAGKAPILFVGINPRMTPGNQWLHELVMSDRSAFDQLAVNRVNGKRYIQAIGGERHYKYHQGLVECVFGAGVEFEAHAAVTELFLCAKASSLGLPRDGSPCADRYFGRTMIQVQPKVVVAVGRPVEEYLRRLGRGTGPTFTVDLTGTPATVIAVPHPNHHGPRLARWREACRLAKAVITGERP
jgi:uracil-DNA glycosylase